MEHRNAYGIYTEVTDEDMSIGDSALESLGKRAQLSTDDFITNMVGGRQVEQSDTAEQMLKQLRIDYTMKQVDNDMANINRISTQVDRYDMSDSAVKTPHRMTLGPTGPRGIPGLSSYDEPDRSVKYVADTVMEMRDKIDDLINGESPLHNLLSKTTIRELIKELRHEIRDLKMQNEVTELDIIKHMEEEHGKREVRRDHYGDTKSADPVSRSYDPGGEDGEGIEWDNIPF